MFLNEFPRLQRIVDFMDKIKKVDSDIFWEFENGILSPIVFFFLYT